MVRGETMGIFASLLILSVVGPALSQWKVANPWGHGPLRVVNNHGARGPPRPPPRHIPPPRHVPPPRHIPRPAPHPRNGMPTHWNRQPRPMPRPQPVHHHQPRPVHQPRPMHRPAPAHPHHQPHYPQPHRPTAHGHAATGHGAHAPSTAATPIEKEPLEIEGPTTTPRPAAYPSYHSYPGAPSYGGHAPAPTHHGAHAHHPPPRWPARPPPPRRPPPVHPPRQPTHPHPSGGYHGAHQQPAGGHHHGGYPQPAAGPPPQRPSYRPPPHARPQPGAGYPQHHHGPGGHGYRPMGHGHGHAHMGRGPSNDPLSKYDIFSTNFDINTFHHAHQKAYQETTPGVLAALGGGGGGGTGTNDFSISGWAQSLASSFGLPTVTTTPRPPPTTTPNHKVHVNPYRHGGLFLADPNKKPQKKPSTQIIEIKKMDLGNGITHNPMMGWLGNTPPPTPKETTPLPGKDGDIFSGFMGFHSSDQGTTPSSKQASNQIQNKFQTFFAPVPVTNNNQNNPWGPGGQGPGGTSAAGGGGGGAMSGMLAGKMDQIKQTLCREMGLLCH